MSWLALVGPWSLLSPAALGTLGSPGRFLDLGAHGARRSPRVPPSHPLRRLGPTSPLSSYGITRFQIPRHNSSKSRALAPNSPSLRTRYVFLVQNFRRVLDFVFLHLLFKTYGQYDDVSVTHPAASARCPSLLVSHPPSVRPTKDEHYNPTPKRREPSVPPRQRRVGPVSLADLLHMT